MPSPSSLSLAERRLVAARAAGLAAGVDGPAAIERELRWQLARLLPATRAALARLPPVGEPGSGPLGPGLLSRGDLGAAIARLQAELGDATRR